MDTVLFDNLREFVKPYYIDKDFVENLEHVKRLLNTARDISEGENVDDDLLVFGAYFQGLIFSEEEQIRNFLFSLGLDRDRVIQIMRVAWESGKDAQPESPEGACLHDANLIEGGKEYQLAKALVLEAAAGHPLPQIIAGFEKQLQNNYQCHTEKARRIYGEINAYCADFLQALRQVLEKAETPSEDQDATLDKNIGEGEEA